jgi:hypothetical protein
VKLRRAAALAIVGWYLMLAPRTSDSPPVTDDVNAPLNKWKTVGSYDTAAECDAGKKDTPATIYNAEEGMSEQQKKVWTQTIMNLLEASICIATDDPRLKPQ